MGRIVQSWLQINFLVANSNVINKIGNRSQCSIILFENDIWKIMVGVVVVEIKELRALRNILQS